MSALLGEPLYAGTSSPCVNFMERFVHFDFKGAPLKVPYLEKVILMAKTWGATGILLEWEDTFPYCGDIVNIGSMGPGNREGIYSMEEVKHVLDYIKANDMKAIQLVQTIGHMEYVLKHPEYKHLREEPYSPAVLCPSKEQSQRLVRAIVDQMLEMQPDANYIHIGADEVWHINVCPDCQKKTAENRYFKDSLYLQHIQDLCTEIKDARPGINILIWDDMLRQMEVDVLREYHLGKLVQPVVWDYNTEEYFNMNQNTWRVYRQVFNKVWVASAYKGANGSSKIVSPVQRYVSNHVAWMKEMYNNASQINFCGIVLTGWSRYDHFATLCELTPVSLPCLASCLKTLTRNILDNGVVLENLPSSEWPGEDVARAIQKFVDLRDQCYNLIHGDSVSTWLNQWQVERGYTNPLHLEGILTQSQTLISRLTATQAIMQSHLHSVTGKRSVEEWVHTLVTPLLRDVIYIYNIASERVNLEASVVPVSPVA